MRLSEEQALQDNNRFANCNVLAELKYCGWEIPQRRAITNDEIRFYAWLCRSAVSLLKEQEVMSWINVKDGFPNESGSYLVVYKAFQYTFVDVKRFAKDLSSVDEYDFHNEHRPGWYEYDDEYGYIERNDITHWMPLPNLPKEER